MATLPNLYTKTIPTHLRVIYGNKISGKNFLVQPAVHHSKEPKQTVKMAVKSKTVQSHRTIIHTRTCTQGGCQLCVTGVIVLSAMEQPSLCHFGSPELFIHLSTTQTYNRREHQDKSQK